MIYSLQMLHELRKSIPLTGRVGGGRLFQSGGSWGLVDNTCALWPVVLPQGFTPHVGAWISFSSQYRSQHKKSSQKFEDTGYLIHLEKILDITKSNGIWPAPGIPYPLLNLEKVHTQYKESHTNFIPSPSQERWRFLKIRKEVLQVIREFFDRKEFLEVETPTLVPSGGVERYLDPFETQYEDHKGKKHKLQLPTSPEFALKKLMTEGAKGIYQLSRSYRNKGELSAHHEPEFLLLEWYERSRSFQHLINTTWSLINSLHRQLGSIQELPQELPHFRVDKLFHDLLGLELEQLNTTSTFYQQLQGISNSITETDSWDTLFSKVFMEKVEPYLQQQKACVVTHFPLRMGALARQEGNGKPFVERFELYIAGVEICNGYNELCDTDEIRHRFSTIESQVREEGRASIVQDPVFLDTMRFGLPQCVGNALGVDRLISLFVGGNNIQKLSSIPFLSQFPHGKVADK